MSIPRYPSLLGVLPILVTGVLFTPLRAQQASVTLPAVRVAHSGHGSTGEGKPFVPLGVTYYRPGTGWAPQVWKKFDPEATRRDFARMKTLGVNCVRVFLTYGSFYNEPGVLNPEGLARFDQFLVIAEAAGIYVHPTGPDHWEGTPPWAAGDRFADPRALSAIEAFWKLFAQRYRGRPVIFAYDLQNEPSIPWDTPAMRTRWTQWLQSHYGSAEAAAKAWGTTVEAAAWGLPPPAKDAPGDPRLLDYQRLREEVADEWTRRQVTTIKAADPEALVTVGMIQWSVPSLLPGVQHYAAFRPARQAKLLDFLEIHFYPLASGFYEYSNKEAEQQNLAYLESVVREVAACDKPVVVAEFGWYGGGRLSIDQGRHPPADEQQQAAWCRQLVESTRGLATGWLNWGLFDQPEARDVSQLTGLLTSDGREKAWGRAFQDLSRSLSGQSIARVPLGPRPSLDWDRLTTSAQAGHEFRQQYLKAWLADRPATKP